jgi:hypothetical protein
MLDVGFQGHLISCLREYNPPPMVLGDKIALLVSGLKQDKQGKIFSSSLAKVIRGGLPLTLSPMSPWKKVMVSKRSWS